MATAGDPLFLLVIDDDWKEHVSPPNNKINAPERLVFQSVHQLFGRSGACILLLEKKTSRVTILTAPIFPVTFFSTEPTIVTHSPKDRSVEEKVTGQERRAHETSLRTQHIVRFGSSYFLRR